MKRWKSAMKETEQPVIIASKEEADERMKTKATETKTWHYKAQNVRDFGWATSRRFIWGRFTLVCPMFFITLE